MKIAITPHNIEPDCVKATKATLAMLPMSPVENMSEDLDDKGRIIGETNTPGFVKFMVEQQGYAKLVEQIEVP